MSAFGIIITTFVFFMLAVAGWWGIAPFTSDPGLTRVMVVLTPFCMYVFWLCTYLSQLNPIISPELECKNIYLDLNTTAPYYSACHNSD
eukprot:m.46376 g.46376  ORF g.46376 m.46376 type:complete len:89 (-) comp47397_c0_seq1:110-376(-)